MSKKKKYNQRNLKERQNRIAVDYVREFVDSVKALRLSQEENQKQIDAFLERNPHLRTKIILERKKDITNE